MGRARQNMLCMLGKARTRKFGLESPGLETSGLNSNVLQPLQSLGWKALGAPGARRTRARRALWNEQGVCKRVHFV